MATVWLVGIDDTDNAERASAPDAWRGCWPSTSRLGSC